MNSFLHEKKIFLILATIITMIVSFLIYTLYLTNSKNVDLANIDMVSAVNNSQTKGFVDIREPEIEQPLWPKKQGLESQNIDKHSSAVINSKWASPENTHKVLEWRKNYGYFSEDDLLNYESYDLSSLKELSKQGDFLAMHALSKKLLHLAAKDASYVETYRQINILTAAYGSTVTLKDLAEHFKSLHTYGARNKMDDSHLIESAAYHQVALKRGDGKIDLFFDAGDTLEKQFKSLTNEQKNRVQQKANKIYARLERIRKKHNLGSFDSSIPGYVLDYNENLKNYIKTKGD